MSFSRPTDLYEPFQDQYVPPTTRQHITPGPLELPGPPLGYTGLDRQTGLASAPSRWHLPLSTPPETMLEDHTRYITKDEDSPAAGGGFGQIWKCTYRRDRGVTKVAVKSLTVYTTDSSIEKEKKVMRIQRELMICARLQHRHILPIYGYTYGFGPLEAIVSPWAGKGNLTAYLSGAAFCLVRRFQILRDIADGLKYLHANNVIHGDLSGNNVLIYDDGTACLADFGHSLMYSESVSISQASFTSTLQGNTLWMAPEFFETRHDRSEVRPSKQSDIYSFGGIMLQVLTNKVPYYYIPSQGAVIRCITELRKPCRLQYPAISDKHWYFIGECWSADPKKRPSVDRVFDVIKHELDILSSSRGIPLHYPHPQTANLGSRGDRNTNQGNAPLNHNYGCPLRRTREVDYGFVIPASSGTVYADTIRQAGLRIRSGQQYGANI